MGLALWGLFTSLESTHLVETGNGSLIRFRRGERWEVASRHNENKIPLPIIFTVEEGKGMKELLDRSRH